MHEILEGMLGRVLANEAALDMLVNLVLTQNPNQTAAFIENLGKFEEQARNAFIESPSAAEAFAKRAAKLRELAVGQ